MQKELKSNSEAIGKTINFFEIFIILLYEGCMLKRGPRVWCGTDRNIIVWTITVILIIFIINMMIFNKIF